MKTQTQVDVFGQAAADTELYGQRLEGALTKAYYAAQEDDTKTVAQVFAEAIEHQAKINEAMAYARAAVRELTGVPAERTLQSSDGRVDVEDAFNEAQDRAGKLGGLLEMLEEAICRGNYAKASEEFDRTFQRVDNLRDHLADNISPFLDAINPEIIDRDALHDAARTVARMSAFVELIAQADYARRNQGRVDRYARRH